MTLPSITGIPVTVLAAYQHATDRIASGQPGCHLPLPLLAAIGKVESGHANGGDVDASGTTRSRILGPLLDGSDGVAAVPDTDHGRWDDDPASLPWDRAVGPMQFLPSTWQRWGADGNNDGTDDPNNVYDATLAAGHYLCAAGGDLATGDGIQRAILAYNHSTSYLNLVEAWMRVYGNGTTPVPDSTGAPAHHPDPSQAPPPARQQPTPANPGPAAPQPPETAVANPNPAAPRTPGPTLPGGGSGGALGGIPLPTPWLPAPTTPTATIPSKM